MKYINNRPWILAVAVAVAVVLWMLSGHSPSSTPVESSTTEAQAPGKRPTVLVRKQTAEPVTRFVVLNGRTAPARVVELNAETQGRVEQIGAARGDQVKVGTMIVRLDGRDRQSRLDEARATVTQRELEYEARQALKQESYISDSQLAEGLAQLEAARAELKRAELDLTNMIIRAPFDGALHDRIVEIGDYLTAGDPVATFVENQTLIVTGGVSENDIGAIETGMKGQATLVTGQEVTGAVRYVAPVAEDTTRTFTVELEVPNPDGKLPAGVTAEMRLPVETVNAHKISPALLTLDDQGNLGIKTVDASGTVIFNHADISTSSSDGVWILGLPEQASIIVQGQGFVKPGEFVDAVLDGQETAVAAEYAQ